MGLIANDILQITVHRISTDTCESVLHHLFLVACFNQCLDRGIDIRDKRVSVPCDNISLESVISLVEGVEQLDNAHSNDRILRFETSCLCRRPYYKFTKQKAEILKIEKDIGRSGLNCKAWIH
jgi:hypothetical protein